MKNLNPEGFYVSLKLNLFAIFGSLKEIQLLTEQKAMKILCDPESESKRNFILLFFNIIDYHRNININV